jgi:hypothetical protein
MITGETYRKRDEMESREKDGKKEWKEGRDGKKHEDVMMTSLMGRIGLGVAVDIVTLICFVVEVTDMAWEWRCNKRNASKLNGSKHIVQSCPY